MRRKGIFDGFEISAEFNNASRLASVPEIRCPNCGGEVEKDVREPSAPQVRCPIGCPASSKAFSSEDEMNKWLAQAQNSLG